MLSNGETSFCVQLVTTFTSISSKCYDDLDTAQSVTAHGLFAHADDEYTLKRVFGLDNYIQHMRVNIGQHEVEAGGNKAGGGNGQR